jgi:hypothetical protein
VCQLYISQEIHKGPFIFHVIYFNFTIFLCKNKKTDFPSQNRTFFFLLIRQESIGIRVKCAYKNHVTPSFLVSSDCTSRTVSILIFLLQSTLILDFFLYFSTYQSCNIIYFKGNDSPQFILMQRWFECVVWGPIFENYLKHITYMFKSIFTQVWFYLKYGRHSSNLHNHKHRQITWD